MLGADILKVLSQQNKKLINTNFVHFIVFFFQFLGGTRYSFAGLRTDQQHLGFPGELLQHEYFLSLF